MIQLWSWVLAILGMVATWTIGRRMAVGWLIALAAQVGWTAFAVAFGQWGFLLSSAFYFVVDIKIWLQWRQEDGATQTGRGIAAVVVE